MNITSRTTLRVTRQATHQSWSMLLILLSGLLLSACDSVPNEPSVTGGGSGSSAAAYTGVACNATAQTASVEDVCNFQTEFWAKMLDASGCENCHNTKTGSQSPYFMDTADINTAYAQMTNPGNPLVDRTTPANSKVIAKITNNHNCGSPSTCAALATNATTYITNWVNGGVAGAGLGGETNAITLTSPRIKDTGSSKDFADADLTNFAPLHTILKTNCSNCHTDSASVPQTPFFAVDDPSAAYDALVSGQKINLDTPRESRLVARMDEGHNCWALGSTLPENVNNGRKDCAVLMEQAIETFAGTIQLPPVVNPAWVASKALTLLDGTVASGGARDDSSTIALYEFKAGSGATIQDTGGVGVPLNLKLSGIEGTDYRWVGGWGVEFLTSAGKAQATTQASRKLLTQILGSGQYSIEAWVVPANVTQGDANNPARIINYSGGSNERNFTVGQAEYRYAFINRSSAELSPNGNTFLTDDMDEDLQSTQQHIVVTFDLVNGRRVYVNGVDVSTTGNADADPLLPAGNLVGWDPTYAFSMGNEADFSKPWEGKLRLVAIHNRAMTPTQIQQNFDAGVGQKFFMLFSVSDQMNDPTAGDSNCFQASAITSNNPRGDQCFVYFVASQFDTYSYLFTQPTFVSLNPGFTPTGSTTIKGMRIGMNGKEPAVGQAFINIDTTISAVNGYDSATKQQVLNNVGTVMALEKGAGSDEFFLTFEDFGGNLNARVVALCGSTLNCPSPTAAAANTDPKVGLRTFEEILVSMQAMTGVDPYDTARFPKVLKTYFDDSTGTVTGIKQQLPADENATGFLAAHEMAVAQLAIAYCDALVDDVPLRDSFFGTFAFGSPVATAFASSTEKNQIVDALYDKMVGIGGVALSNMPSKAQLETELVGPDDATAIAGGHPGNLFSRLSPVSTPAVVKALCTSVLGSAAMIIQ